MQVRLSQNIKSRCRHQTATFTCRFTGCRDTQPCTKTGLKHRTRIHLNISVWQQLQTWRRCESLRLYRVGQKSLCTYRRRRVYSESPCILVHIHLSYLLKLQQTLKMATNHIGHSATNEAVVTLRSSLLGCYAVYVVSCLPTFRDSLPVPSSTGPIGCLETSVND